MDFSLTPEQQRLQSLAREFAQHEVAPLAREADEAREFPLHLVKRMVNNEWNMDLLSAIEAEAQAQALLMMGQDHRIFYEAFLEKAKPAFIGR